MDDERFAPEPPKDTALGRNPFARDRARVLHSAAFRRLATKTQVRPAGADDFLRTRLTHSLEVAQIGRELGERLGCDPDVVDTACLAHDLGHPPFGHNGEDALNAISGACGGFEGNAQTLRVVARLEAKVEGAGLNLTRATLDALCKYPWLRRPDTRKFGVYDDDRDVFDWLRLPDTAARRCLEAQVMDWSDDVAYSVHDLEDGIHGGYIRLAMLADPDERDALCHDVAREYSPETPDFLGGILDELLADPVVAPVAGYDGSQGAQRVLKMTTSVLTGRFVTEALTATWDRFGKRPLSRYAADLIVPDVVRAQCALLKGMTLRYVMHHPNTEPERIRQREILTELVRALTERAPDSLDPVFTSALRAAKDDASRLRVIIDQVASLTDPAAVTWHRRLVSGNVVR